MVCVAIPKPVKGSTVASVTGWSNRAVIILALFLLIPAWLHAGWQFLEPGLSLGRFESPQLSESGDSMIRVLRIDTRHFRLRLLNASALTDGRSLPVREWCLQFDLQAGINASMYQEDRITSVSLMRTTGHINNPRLSRDKTILAFDPVDSSGPAVRLIDRQCDNFNRLKNRFRTLVQSIRMISCRGTNVWHQQSERWSTAALALDRDGHVLFIHVQSPYSTHDLINILQALPLGIERAMYLEGGPEAQLYVRSGERSWEFHGSYGGRFSDPAPPTYAWPIPNVIGIARTASSTKD